MFFEMIICVFVSGSSSPGFTDEGLHIFTYTRHLWSLSSEGSLVCHIFCVTGHLNMVISKNL